MVFDYYSSSINQLTTSHSRVPVRMGRQVLLKPATLFSVSHEPGSITIHISQAKINQMI
jgi:hypothetical protein